MKWLWRLYHLFASLFVNLVHKLPDQLFKAGHLHLQLLHLAHHLVLVLHLLPLLLDHDLLGSSHDAPTHLVHSETTKLFGVPVRPNCDTLVRDEHVEQEDLGGPEGREEPLEGGAAVELAKKSTAG